MSNQERIEEFVIKEFRQDLKDFTIVKENNTSFLFFDKYRIKRTIDIWGVSHLRITDTHIFYNLKSAVTWCIFEHYKNYYDANRIKDLDRIITDQETSIQLYQKLLKTSKEKEQKCLYITKLTEGLCKKKIANQELEKFINTSRTLLNKKFKTGVNKSDYR